MKGRPYIFWTLPYREDSVGVVATYILASALRSHGYIVRATLIDHVWCSNPYKIPYISRDQITEDVIHVFPEICRHRLHRNDRVAWWMLYTPGRWAALPRIQPQDLVFTWMHCMYPGHPQLMVNTVDTNLFKPTVRNKEGILYYIGKGSSNFDSSKVPDGARLITRSPDRWPATRVELIELLASSELLISFDPLTQLNLEATLVGTPVRIHLENSDWSEKTLDKDVLEWPGYAWSNGQIPQAKEKVNLAYPQYLKKIPMMDRTVDRFVKITQERWK